MLRRSRSAIQAAPGTPARSPWAPPNQPGGRSRRRGSGCDRRRGKKLGKAQAVPPRTLRAMDPAKRAQGTPRSSLCLPGGDERGARCARTRIGGIQLVPSRRQAAPRIGGLWGFGSPRTRSHPGPGSSSLPRALPAPSSAPSARLSAPHGTAPRERILRPSGLTPTPASRRTPPEAPCPAAPLSPAAAPGGSGPRSEPRDPLSAIRDPRSAPATAPATFPQQQQRSGRWPVLATPTPDHAP